MRRIAVLIGACVALAGCGGGGGNSNSAETSGSSAASAQQTVTVSEAEFSLTPNVVNVGRPGTVAFLLDAPRQSATLTVQLSEAGTWEMYCPIDGHEAKGMKGAVRVAGSSGTSGAKTTGGTTTDEGMTTTEGTTTDDKGGSGY